MIERMMIGGQPATVSYIKGNFEPATPDDFEMMKIIFDNGKTVWARPKPETPSPNGAMDKYNPNEPRIKGGEGGGRWTSSGGGAAPTPEAKAGAAPAKAKVSVNVQREDGSLEKVELPDEIADMARHMPEAPDRYFETAGAEMLPVSKLVQQRARPGGIANAVKYMQMAYRGEYGKRGPIHVQKLDDGNYRVLDGNSTTTIASAAGWEKIPALVIPDESYLPKKEPKQAATAPEAQAASAPEATKPTAPPREELIGDFSKPKGDTSQNFKTLDDVYEKARADEKQANQRLIDAATAVGGKAVFDTSQPGTTLKSRSSAERKLKEPDVNGDPGKLKDIVRGTIMCDTTEQSRGAAKIFMQMYGDKIVRLDDRMVNPADGGYRDIIMNYRTPSGLIAEVQFNTPEMIKLKNGEGHHLFEQIKKIPKPPLTLRQRLLYDSLNARSERLYMEAYKKDGNTNWKTGEHHFGAGDKTIAGDIGDEMTDPDAKIEIGQFPDEWWKLTPPDGEPFYFRMVYGDKCYSTATGKWEEDDRFHFADLCNPQYNMNDWTATRLPGPPDDAPPI